MQLDNLTLQAEANRQQHAERLARARTPRLPATTHRHVLAERLRRIADRLDG